jgi:hypothetical protein
MEMPANVIIGADGRIVGYFMGFPEIEDLVQAIQDGRITTTRPSQAAFKAFNESKKVLVEAEAPRMPRAEDHKPSFPPSFTVHVSPSRGEERSNSSSGDFWALQGFTLKEAIELLYTSTQFVSNYPLRSKTTGTTTSLSFCRNRKARSR